MKWSCGLGKLWIYKSSLSNMHHTYFCTKEIIDLQGKCLFPYITIFFWDSVLTSCGEKGHLIFFFSKKLWFVWYRWLQRHLITEIMGSLDNYVSWILLISMWYLSKCDLMTYYFVLGCVLSISMSSNVKQGRRNQEIKRLEHLAEKNAE